MIKNYERKTSNPKRRILRLANANLDVVSLPLHGFMSGVHTKEDIDQTVSAFRDVFELLKK